MLYLPPGVVPRRPQIKYGPRQHRKYTIIALNMQIWLQVNGHFRIADVTCGIHSPNKCSVQQRHKTLKKPVEIHHWTK